MVCRLGAEWVDEHLASRKARLWHSPSSLLAPTYLHLDRNQPNVLDTQQHHSLCVVPQFGLPRIHLHLLE